MKTAHFEVNRQSILQRAAALTVVLAIAFLFVCPPVRPTVRPSHSGIVPK